MSDPRIGLTVTHRRYVPHAHAHYGGSLVDGAYTLGLFGDVATEVAIVMDGDEGLLAGYSEVRFLGPVRAGDVLEASAEVVRVGRRSRELRCRAQVVARAEPERGPSAARVLDPPQTVVEATATLVVPAAGVTIGSHSDTQPPGPFAPADRVPTVAAVPSGSTVRAARDASDRLLRHRRPRGAHPAARSGRRRGPGGDRSRPCPRTTVRTVRNPRAVRRPRGAAPGPDRPPAHPEVHDRSGSGPGSRPPPGATEAPATDPAAGGMLGTDRADRRRSPPRPPGSGRAVRAGSPAPASRRSRVPAGGTVPAAVAAHAAVPVAPPAVRAQSGGSAPALGRLVGADRPGRPRRARPVAGLPRPRPRLARPARPGRARPRRHGRRARSGFWSGLVLGLVFLVPHAVVVGHLRRRAAVAGAGHRGGARSWRWSAPRPRSPPGCRSGRCGPPRCGSPTRRCAAGSPSVASRGPGWGSARPAAR